VLVRIIVFLGVFASTVWWFPGIRLIDGIIWQPTCDYVTPKGNWDKIGANKLLVQWSLLEDKVWIHGLGYKTWDTQPNWNEILKEPWAEEIVWGLSGDFNLNKARDEWRHHVVASTKTYQALEKLNIPSKMWYAPIEVDPSWKLNEIKSYLSGMPKPLYISSFTGSYDNPDKYAKWVSLWLPEGAKLIFQDSVGTNALSLSQSQEYITALVDELGEDRVGVILEAFEIRKQGSKIESAPILSVARRLVSYQQMNIEVYIFSCRYINSWDIFLVKLYALVVGWW